MSSMPWFGRDRVNIYSLLNWKVGITDPSPKQSPAAVQENISQVHSNRIIRGSGNKKLLITRTSIYYTKHELVLPNRHMDQLILNNAGQHPSQTYVITHEMNKCYNKRFLGIHKTLGRSNSFHVAVFRKWNLCCQFVSCCRDGRFGLEIAESKGRSWEGDSSGCEILGGVLGDKYMKGDGNFPKGEQPRSNQCNCSRYAR